MVAVALFPNPSLVSLLNHALDPDMRAHASNVLRPVLLILFLAPPFSRQRHPQVNEKEGKLAHLVTVTPEEVLGAEVLVGVLGALLKRGRVGLVLPVLAPQPVGVGARDGESGNDDAEKR